MALLEIKYVTKAFGGLYALRDVTFDISKGEILSLIGPNGAGKSTLFNCINGFLPLDSGDISFQQKSIKGLSPNRISSMGIGRTFQMSRPFYKMTILENVIMGQHSHLRTGILSALIRPKWVKQEEMSARVKGVEILKLFQERLLPRTNDLAQSLSYANRRRLEIARALAQEPNLLLLDEPTAGMNPQETEQIIELIRKIRDTGITITVIEHDMKVIQGVSDRVVVLDHGEKIAEGPYEEIQHNENVIQAYMGRRYKHAEA
jgi:ABC-type branched-subunit amino acid transport system ATPase component